MFNMILLSFSDVPKSFNSIPFGDNSFLQCLYNSRPKSIAQIHACQMTPSLCLFSQVLRRDQLKMKLGDDAGDEDDAGKGGKGKGRGRGRGRGRGKTSAKKPQPKSKPKSRAKGKGKGGKGKASQKDGVEEEEEENDNNDTEESDEEDAGKDDAMNDVLTKDEEEEANHWKEKETEGMDTKEPSVPEKLQRLKSSVAVDGAGEQKEPGDKEEKTQALSAEEDKAHEKKDETSKKKDSNQEVPGNRRKTKKNLKEEAEARETKKKKVADSGESGGSKEAEKKEGDGEAPEGNEVAAPASSKAPRKRKGEVGTFARRVAPKGEFAKKKWEVLRDCFVQTIKPHLTHYSAHEDFLAQKGNGVVRVVRDKEQMFNGFPPR